MRIIAHRGNIDGPCPVAENHPDYVLEAIKRGYDVEVDVRMTDSGLYLGHDEPVDLVPMDFVRNSKIWAHAKDPVTFGILSKFPDVNCFYQESDAISVTNQGFIWCHKDHPVRGPRSVVYWDGSDPMANEILESGACGVYTDYAGLFRLGNQHADSCDLPFDLLVIDIDGVMTDGTKLYGRDGTVLGKRYCDLDFTAIKRFKSAGVKVCFLSGDRTVNEEMARTRRVDFHHNPPGVDKVSMLRGVAQEYYTSPSRIAYVGDDYYDVGIMSHVGFSFCPASSPAPTKRAATIVLPVEAGKGVLASLYDAFEDKLPNVYPTDSPEVNPK